MESKKTSADEILPRGLHPRDIRVRPAAMWVALQRIANGFDHVLVSHDLLVLPFRTPFLLLYLGLGVALSHGLGIIDTTPLPSVPAPYGEPICLLRHVCDGRPQLARTLFNAAAPHLLSVL